MAANNKIQYVLGISADTSQAKKSIAELQKALNDITVANNKKLGLDIDLNNAAKAAQQLQSSLSAAINVDTGRLNFTAFNKSLMQSNTNLNQLITQLRSTGGLGNAAVSQLARSLSTAEIPVRRLTGLLGNFATTLSNSFKWQISSNIIHGLESSMSSAVNYAKDLNETLNNIRIVTGQSVDDMAKFAASANKAAQELSTTTKEYANAALIYYQQGDSAEMAARKAATTVKAANVAFTASAKEMSEMLTAVWNSYQVGADQLESVVDVMAKLGATTASSMEEMATAMQKVASTANTVGVSMQQMSAIVATSASVTRQAPETVGTAWNTILSRIGGLKLGETLEDGVDLNKYSSALRTVGVNILDATGQLRDMGIVIDELGGKWQTLSKGQKAALAQTIGGARQYTQIMAFFDNFDKYQKNMITAQNSAGALQEQQEIYAQGWEAASARSRAALEDLWGALIDDEAVISFTNAMTEMTKGVTGLVKAFGGLPGILATVSSLMTRTFSNQIVNGVSKAAASIVGFGQAFTKQGNGQPMSGGYTVRQFLTGRMPNAEERQQISNLAVTRDVLLQTAQTGAGLDKENPFYNQLRQSNSLQADAYTDQIQTMRQGGNLTPVQMLNLANLQQRAEHTQNAYNILDAFHEDTSTVTSNLINTDQGASEIFSKLSGAMYREELERIQDRAINATGDELKAYQSQFADIAKKANLNVAFGQYQRASSFKSSDTLMREMGARQYAGLTEAERRQIIADTRQSTAQSIQATRSQFNPNGQIDPTSQFKAIGEAARTAVTGITSGIAAFNQLNSVIQAFDSGNVVQGLTGIATSATSVAQAFITGGPWAGAIASAGAILGLVVGKMQIDFQKAAESAKKTSEEIVASTSDMTQKVSNVTTQQNSFNNLQQQLANGKITQEEYNDSLLNIANSLEINGASVLALSGNYKQLEDQVKSTLQAQLESNQAAAQALSTDAQNAAGSVFYNSLSTYGLRTNSKATDQYFSINNLDNIGLLNTRMFNRSAIFENGKSLAEIVGLDVSDNSIYIGNSFEELQGTLNKLNQAEEIINNFLNNADPFIRAQGQYLQTSFDKISSLRSAINAGLSPYYDTKRSEYTSSGQLWAQQNITTGQGYDLNKREDYTKSFLDSINLTDTSSEAYKIGKEVIETIIDSTIAGLNDGGQALSSGVAGAANVKSNWEKQLKQMGWSDQQIQGFIKNTTSNWSATDWNNAYGVGAYVAGAPNAVNRTEYNQATMAQSALQSWWGRGENFDLTSFVNSFIFSNDALSTQFANLVGLNANNWESSNSSQQMQAISTFIDYLVLHQNDFIEAANNESKNNAEPIREARTAFEEYLEPFGLSLQEIATQEFKSTLDRYNSLRQQQEEEINATDQQNLERIEALGGIDRAYAAYYQGTGLLNADTNNPIKAVNQSSTNLMQQAQFLANIDLDPSKWKNVEQVLSYLTQHNKVSSLSDWLGLSDLEKSQIQLDLVNQKIAQIKAKMQEEGIGESDELIQLEHLAKQLQLNLDQLSLKSLQEQINTINQEWEEMQGHAEKVMDLISSHMGKGFQSFSDIEALRQSLLGAGIEGERVASIIKEIQDLGNDGKTDDKDAWAGVGAATAAALVSVSADQQKNKGYEGLVDKATVQQLDLSGAKFIPEVIDVPAESSTVDTTEAQQIGEKPQVATVAEQVEVSTETPIAGEKPKIDSIVASAINAVVSQDSITHSNLESLDANSIKADVSQEQITASHLNILEADSINAKVEQGKIDYNDIECLRVEKVDAAGESTKYELSESEKLKVALLYTGEGVTVEGLEDKTFSLETVLSILPETTEDGQSTDFIQEWLKENYPDGVKFDAEGNITGFDTSSEKAVAAANAANEALKGKLSTEIELTYGAPTDLNKNLEKAVQHLETLNATVGLIYGEVVDANGTLKAAQDPGVKPIELKYVISKDYYKMWVQEQSQKAAGTEANILSIDQFYDFMQNGSFNKSYIPAAAATIDNLLASGQLSAKDFNGENPIANMITEMAAQALASEDQDMRFFGQMLVAGLAYSLGDAVHTVDWAGILAGLGPEIYDAFASELQTHSPSRLTWVFGQFLISGVQGGLSEAIQNYKADASGLGAKIFAAFQDELKDGSIEASINQQAAAYADKMVEMTGSSEWIKVYQAKQKELWDNEVNTFERDYLAGGYLQDNNLSKEEKVALDSAVKTALTKAGKESLNEIDDELFDSIQQEINKLYTNNINSINNTVAKMRDIWKGALDTVYKNEQESAQKTYEVWEKTFQSIAKAREALLNGQSITDAMGTDAGDMTNMLRLLMKQHGFTKEQAIAFMNDPNASLSTLDYDTYDGKTREEYWSSGGREYFTKEMLDPNRKWNVDEQWESYQKERLRQTKEDLYGENGIQTLRDTIDNLLSIVNNPNASSEEQSAALSQLQNWDNKYSGFQIFDNLETGKKDYSMSDSDAQGILYRLIGDLDSLTMFAQGRGFQNKTAMEEGYFEGAGQDLANQNKINNQVWEEEASIVGKSTDAVKEHAKALLELQGDYRNLSELTESERKQMAQVAAENLRAADGWKTLGSTSKKTFEIIKQGSKANSEYIPSIEKIQTALKQVFGNSKAITADFVKDHIKQIEKMANGDKKAGEEIEEAILRSQAAMDGWDYDQQVDIDINSDGVVDQLDTVGELFNNFGDEYADKLAGFEVNIDKSDALNTLDELLSSGQMTVDQMNAAFATIGWIPEIEYQDVTVAEAQKMGINGEITATLPDGQTFVGTIDGNEDALADAIIHIPHIKSAKKTGGGGSSAPKPSRGGGGGGGGKEHTKKEHKRIKDEGERYHEIRDKLEQQEHILDRIDKVKDRAYGGRHLKALNAEIEALEKQNKLQEEYYAEAAAYLASDRAELTQYGATFNPDGTINYDEYIRKQVNWYNAQVDASDDDETDKRIEEEYKDRMKALENYEEALDLVDTIQNDILENQNKISEILLEGVQYKLEIAVDLNDRDLQKLDYYISKWSEVLSKQDESMEVSMMKMGNYESSLAAIGKAYQELQKGYAEGRLNDQDYSDGLADLQDKTLEYLESIQDLKKEIEEYYENTLSLAEEKQQKYTDKIEHTRNMMQSYIEMQQLMGRGQNFAELNSMYDTSYRSSLLTARAARDYLDTLYASRAAIVKEIEDSGWTETLKAQYDSVEEHIVNAEDDLAQKTQQTLDDAKQKFMNVIDAIIKASDLAFKSLVDANGNLIKSFDEVAQDFNYWNEQQGWYVSTAKELYEVSKINRQIEDSLIDSTTATSKERLKALQSEINAYAEKNRLTEYDIEMNELQYKMALAMQNLEDTQNAKSTVRLTRDENGNYGYQYTANEDDVSEARQNFEDVLQQINELAYEHQNDLVQQMIESKQNYQSELREILDNDTLSLEERNRQAETLTEQHLAQMEYIQEQGLRAQEQLLENQGYIQEYYGQTIIENTGLVQDQIHGMMQQLMQDSSGYVEYIRTTLRQQLDEAIGGYSHDIDKVGGETGLTWGTMENSVSVYNKTNEKAAEDIKTLDQILGDSLKNIASATDSWVKHNAALETTVGNYEQLLNKMQGLQRSLADIDSINDRYYNNGAIYRPSEMGTTAALNALYNNKNTTNFTEDRFEGSANALGRLHNTTMSEYDISTSNLWNLIDSGAMSNLLGLISRGVNPNVINGNTNGDALSQVVNINASFDNIQSAQDIIDAFNQLTNLASQYAYSSGS